MWLSAWNLTEGNADSCKDLCTEALRFCLDVLKPGGSFVCKFYQGGEDSLLETRLKRAFEKVHREKPDSSRKVLFYSAEMDFELMVCRRVASCILLR